MVDLLNLNFVAWPLWCLDIARYIGGNALTDGMLFKICYGCIDFKEFDITAQKDIYLTIKET